MQYDELVSYLAYKTYSNPQYEVVARGCRNRATQNLGSSRISFPLIFPFRLFVSSLVHGTMTTEQCSLCATHAGLRWCKLCINSYLCRSCREGLRHLRYDNHALQQHLDSPIHVPKALNSYSGIPRSEVTPVFATAHRLRFTQPTADSLSRLIKTNLEEAVISAIIAAALRLLPTDDTPQGIELRTEQHRIQGS